MATRSERRIESRRRIVAAAVTLFAAGRYASTNMDDIAREAGCSRTLVYKHFRDREELRGAVIEHQYGWWRHHLSRLGAQATTAPSGITRWLSDFVAGFRSMGEITYLLMSTASLTTRGRDDYRERRRVATEIASRLTLAGPAEDPDRAVRLLTQFVMHAEWACLNLAWADAGEDEALMLGDLAGQYLAIIAAHRARPNPPGARRPNAAGHQKLNPSCTPT